MVIEKLIWRKQLRQIEILENIIGEDFTDERKRKVLQQMWRIKKFFATRKGIVDALVLTIPRLLMAFERYAEDAVKHDEFEKPSYRLWIRFVRECTEGESTEIIEWYL